MMFKREQINENKWNIYSHISSFGFVLPVDRWELCGILERVQGGWKASNGHEELVFQSKGEALNFLFEA